MCEVNELLVVVFRESCPAEGFCIMTSGVPSGYHQVIRLTPEMNVSDLISNPWESEFATPKNKLATQQFPCNNTLQGSHYLPCVLWFLHPALPRKLPRKLAITKQLGVHWGLHWLLVARFLCTGKIIYSAGKIFLCTGAHTTTGYRRRKTLY